VGVVKQPRIEAVANVEVVKNKKNTRHNPRENRTAFDPHKEACQARRLRGIIPARIGRVPNILLAALFSVARRFFPTCALSQSLRTIALFFHDESITKANSFTAPTRANQT